MEFPRVTSSAVWPPDLPRKPSVLHVSPPLGSGDGPCARAFVASGSRRLRGRGRLPGRRVVRLRRHRHAQDHRRRAHRRVGADHQLRRRQLDEGRCASPEGRPTSASSPTVVGKRSRRPRCGCTPIAPAPRASTSARSGPSPGTAHDHPRYAPAGAHARMLSRSGAFARSQWISLDVTAAVIANRRGDARAHDRRRPARRSSPAARPGPRARRSSWSRRARAPRRRRRRPPRRRRRRRHRRSTPTAPPPTPRRRPDAHRRTAGIGFDQRRAYSAGSPWNTRIGAFPTVHPNSAAGVSLIGGPITSDPSAVHLSGVLRRRLDAAGQREAVGPVLRRHRHRDGGHDPHPHDAGHGPGSRCAASSARQTAATRRSSSSTRPPATSGASGSWRRTPPATGTPRTATTTTSTGTATRRATAATGRSARAAPA